MNVEVLYRNDPERPLTDPLPELGGRQLVVRLCRGDYLHPGSDPDGWFGPIMPERVTRKAGVVLPFIAWHWSAVAALLWGAAFAFSGVWAWFGASTRAWVIAEALLCWLGAVALSLFARGRGGYIGGKVYGVDSENYVPWAGRENVYPGSRAMAFSFRPFANLEKEKKNA